MASAPSCSSDELNVTEAWQEISTRVSSTVSRYVRFVAPGMGEPVRSHTCAIEATFHGDVFAAAHVILDPTADLPFTVVVKSLPLPVSTFEIQDVPCSAKHIAPSGPAAIPHGAEPANSVGL